MLADREAIAQRRREQTAASRRADDRHRAELHVDRAGVHALAERDVDPKILHRRVHELLDRLWQPVDLVDEEDRALLGVGEVGEQVLGRGERGAAGDLEADVQLAGDARGEGRLAEPRRAVEQHVPERLPAVGGRLDGDLDPLADVALADDVADPLGTQRDVVDGGGLGVRASGFGRGGRFGRFFPGIVGGENGLARHGWPSWRAGRVGP